MAISKRAVEDSQDTWVATIDLIQRKDTTILIHLTEGRTMVVTSRIAIAHEVGLRCRWPERYRAKWQAEAICCLLTGSRLTTPRLAIQPDGYICLQGCAHEGCVIVRRFGSVDKLLQCRVFLLLCCICSGLLSAVC